MEIDQSDFLQKTVKASLEVARPTVRQDLAWLEQSEKAEETLRALWTSICAYREVVLRRRGLPAAEIEPEFEILRADSSPEDLVTVQEAPESILQRSRRQLLSLPRFQRKRRGSRRLAHRV